MGESVSSLLVMMCILWIIVEVITSLLGTPKQKRIRIAAWIAFTIPSVIMMLGAVYGVMKGMPMEKLLPISALMLVGFGILVWLLYGLRLRISDWTTGLINWVRT